MNNRRKPRGEAKFFITYSTVENEISHHEEACFMLADAGRMPSLKYFTWGCMEAGNFQSFHYYRESRRTVLKFALFTVFETAYFMQWQATSVGFSRCFSDTVDVQTVASVILSLLTTALAFLMTSLNMRKINAAIGKAPIEPAGRGNVPEEEWQKRRRFNVWAKSSGGVRWQYIFYGVAFIYLVAEFYGATKLYMNVYWCECGWNFKGWPLNAGCVNRPEKGNKMQAMFWE